MADIIEKIIKKLDEVKDNIEDSQYIADLKTIDIWLMELYILILMWLKS